jgi:hypothetical protein
MWSNSSHVRDGREMEKYELLCLDTYKKVFGAKSLCRPVFAETHA